MVIFLRDNKLFDYDKKIDYLLYIGVILPEDEEQIKGIIQDEAKDNFNNKDNFIQNLQNIFPENKDDITKYSNDLKINSILKSSIPYNENNPAFQRNFHARIESLFNKIKTNILSKSQVKQNKLGDRPTNNLLSDNQNQSINV